MLYRLPKIAVFGFMLVANLMLSFSLNAEEGVSGKYRTKAFQMHFECMHREGRDACFGYPLEGGVKVYAEPDESSRKLNHPSLRTRVPFHTRLSLIDVRENAKHPGWLPIVAQDGDDIVMGWVRDDRVVPMAELRRVTDCWPIKQLSWHNPSGGTHGLGAYHSLKFDRTGLLLDSKHRGRYSVYYAKSIFRIEKIKDRQSDERNHIWETFGLDYNGGRVVASNRLEKLSIVFLPKDELADCDRIPKVDPGESLEFRMPE